MEKGRIITLGDRSSGFIKLIGTKEPLFFHSDFLEEVHFTDLKLGDKVHCEIQESRSGPYALHVRRA